MIVASIAVLALRGGRTRRHGTDRRAAHDRQHRALDPAFDAVVPTDAALEVLAEGHEWTEGPVWVPELESVLYSDIPDNAIYRWSDETERRCGCWLPATPAPRHAAASQAPTA